MRHHRVEGLPSESHFCSEYARRIAQGAALQLRCKCERSFEVAVGLRKLGSGYIMIELKT